VGVFWYAAWHFAVTSRPADHPAVSPAELTELEAEAGPQAEARKVPLRALLSTMPVWAIVVAHFCNNWSLYVLLSWLPTFVNQGLGVDFAAVGQMAMIPHIALFVFLNVAGTVADRLIRGGMPVGRVRKLMQSIGCLGIGTALAVVGYVESAWMAIAVMSVGNALGAFVTGGFAVNHMDIAPRYAGTLMGITNTAGTIPGIIGVFVSGLILELTGSWTLVFQVASGVTLFGLLFFLAFSSSRRLFD
jgi:MFS transporter, ACS family, solute carrier family 17 (sodium-dependent inorganic phosphate cotransporter), other